MTLLALCLGLTALRLGLDGYFDLAVFCIVAAGFIDGLDGTMARLLKAERRWARISTHCLILSISALYPAS